MAAGQADGAAGPAAEAPRPDLLCREILIPGGHGAAFATRAGQLVEIIDLEEAGQQVKDMPIDGEPAGTCTSRFPATRPRTASSTSRRRQPSQLWAATHRPLLGATLVGALAAAAGSAIRVKR